MAKIKIRKLKGANMDIDLITPPDRIHWRQNKCPWNKREETTKHKCAVKNISICKYFRGIKPNDVVLCSFPSEKKYSVSKNGNF